MRPLVSEKSYAFRMGEIKGALTSMKISCDVYLEWDEERYGVPHPTNPEDFIADMAMRIQELLNES